MKVTFLSCQSEYKFILKYLHYKLDNSFLRKFDEYCKNTSQIFYLIDEPVFEYDNLHFEIKTNEVYVKKVYSFTKYSELIITGLNVTKFISTAIDYIVKNSFNEKQIIYKTCHSMWVESRILVKRDIDTVYLPGVVKSELLNDITNFFKPEIIERYCNLNINHTRMYMLYGVPGTGKTTLIKTLAGYFNKNLAYITINSDTDYDCLLKIIERVPDNTFLCLEDVDALFGEDRKQKSELTFSGFINILDGVNTPENTVVFMTTNKLQDLDHAVKRRINYFIEFKFATKDQIKDMFVRFFPDYAVDFETFYRNISEIEVTINIMEKFFTKYLFDNILEKGKLFSKFANGELKVELNTSSRLYT